MYIAAETSPMIETLAIILVEMAASHSIFIFQNFYTSFWFVASYNLACSVVLKHIIDGWQTIAIFLAICRLIQF